MNNKKKTEHARENPGGPRQQLVSTPPRPARTFNGSAGEGAEVVGGGGLGITAHQRGESAATMAAQPTGKAGCRHCSLETHLVAVSASPSLLRDIPFSTLSGACCEGRRTTRGGSGHGGGGQGWRGEGACHGAPDSADGKEQSGALGGLGGGGLGSALDPPQACVPHRKRAVITSALLRMAHWPKLKISPNISAKSTALILRGNRLTISP